MLRAQVTTTLRQVTVEDAQAQGYALHHRHHRALGAVESLAFFRLPLVSRVEITNQIATINKG